MGEKSAVINGGFFVLCQNGWFPSTHTKHKYLPTKNLAFCQFQAHPLLIQYVKGDFYEI